MDIIVLEKNAEDFFHESNSLETNFPTGRWRFFKFINKNKVLGIFETDLQTKDSLTVHPDFFKYFLGTFTPSTKVNISIHQAESFTSFCIYLNKALVNKKEILDLSVSQKWIWTDGDEYKVPKKLLDFLN